MSQIDPEFPAQGEFPWANKMNTALGLMVTQGNANDAALAELNATDLPWGDATIPTLMFENGLA